MAEANRGWGLQEESSLWVSRWAKRQFLASGFFRSMYSFQECEVLESSYHHWTTVMVVSAVVSVCCTAMCFIGPYGLSCPGQKRFLGPIPDPQEVPDLGEKGR
ncbi:unnamed protein product [Dicrocoelium dendriticum]|nr:unnamed protein product [Dicrocoelium dendriticum]